MNKTWRTMAGGVFCCTLLWPAAASAVQENTDDETSGMSPASKIMTFGAAIDEQSLATRRGGQQDAFFNDMRSRANLSNTSITNVGTGANTITEGAFSNTHGLPMAIQNSGNNVIIQNSTILNLQLR